MNLFNVVLSTEPKGGKGGVATVIPMYMSALENIGKVAFISTHNGRRWSGKFLPWIVAFLKTLSLIFRYRQYQIIFHLHPGSGICIVRMAILAAYLKLFLRQKVIVYLHTPYLQEYLESKGWSRVLRFMARRADKIIVLTRYACDLIKKVAFVKIPTLYQIHLS